MGRRVAVLNPAAGQRELDLALDEDNGICCWPGVGVARGLRTSRLGTEHSELPSLCQRLPRVSLQPHFLPAVVCCSQSERICTSLLTPITIDRLYLPVPGSPWTRCPASQAQLSLPAMPGWRGPSTELSQGFCLGAASRWLQALGLSVGPL